MALSLLLLGALLTSQAAADCSERETIAHVDEERLLGKWYFIQQTSVNRPGIGHIKCQESFFSRSSDGGLVWHSLLYNDTSSSFFTINNNMHRSTAGVSDGKYDVHREGSHGGHAIKWYTLDTDYSNFGVVCVSGKRPGSDEEFEMIMLMARQRKPSASVLEDANGSLPTGSYTTNDQNDCPEYEHN